MVEALQISRLNSYTPDQSLPLETWSGFYLAIGHPSIHVTLSYMSNLGHIWTASPQSLPHYEKIALKSAQRRLIPALSALHIGFINTIERALTND